jgi:hypothetical protein
MVPLNTAGAADGDAFAVMKVHIESLIAVLTETALRVIRVSTISHSRNGTPNPAEPTEVVGLGTKTAREAVLEGSWSRCRECPERSLL